MYSVIALPNGKYQCNCRIQDGTERWEKATLEEALQSMVQAARVMNGSYIRHDEIEVHASSPIRPTANTVSDEDMALLLDIKREAKVVLEHNHYLLKYRLTEEECRLVQAIREGDAKVSWDRFNR